MITGRPSWQLPLNSSTRGDYTASLVLLQGSTLCILWLHLTCSRAEPDHKRSVYDRKGNKTQPILDDDEEDEIFLFYEEFILLFSTFSCMLVDLNSTASEYLALHQPSN